MTKLKPCPFCGGLEASPRHGLSDYPGEWVYIKCLSPLCGATGAAFKTEEVAITAWNTRDASEFSELVEQLLILTSEDYSNDAYDLLIRWKERSNERKC